MDYNKLIKQYDPLIKKQAGCVTRDPDDVKDVEQEIRIFVFNRLKQYDESRDVPIDYYIKMAIYYGFLRQVCSVRKQRSFENSIGRLEPYYNMPEEASIDIKDDILIKIGKLPIKYQVVFYSLLYNYDKKKYKTIADELGIKYMSFRYIVIKIKKIIEGSI